MAEEVLIDFKVDYTELINAQEQLAKGGKIDPAGFASVQKAISSTATDTRGLIQEFKKVATTATQMGKSVESAFGAGVQDALDEAGVSLKDFSAALTKANAPSKTLKTELLDLKNRMAELKVVGKDTGAEFEALRSRAGKLADAIADAGQEIKNAGSDTRQLDNVVGSISALAGGFAAAQGAIALFGEENEDVQKALLKVNGAMALASGIQQFYNATLKEGALTKLADTIATGGQTAAQRIYAVAVGTSTGSMKAFRIALLATGIGALVAVLVLAAQAMGAFGDETDEATGSLKEQKEAADALVDSLDDIATGAANARAAQAGGSDTIKRDIVLAKARGASSQEVFNLEQKLRKKELDELRTLGATYSQQYDTRKRLGTLTAADAEALNNTITEINKKGRDKLTEINAADIENIREQGELAAKNAKEQKELRDKAAKEARDLRVAELRDLLAISERELLLVEKGSFAELELKNKIIRQKRDIELQAEKLTANQVKLIRAQAYADQQKMQEEFNLTAANSQLQSAIDTNAAVLAGITLNNEERLRLQEVNIHLLSQLEINAAEGNAAKILLIEAKKQADIRALRNAAIDEQLADDLKGVEKTNAIIKNGLTQVANDSKESYAVRLAALKGIESQELLQVDKRISANDAKLQSDQDYQAANKALLEERASIEADTAQEIIDLNQDVQDEKIESLKEIGALTIQVAGQVADFFSQLSDLAAEQDQIRIQKQKDELEALEAAGAITAKQAKIRAQEIEIAERRARQAQARREKQAAVFKAVLAIPQAFLTGLSQSLPLAILYAALAAAQAAIIVSKPVPKFFRGKKDRYEGPAIVGDMGSELVERNGRMFIYTKPTKTYLGAMDKVYTAAETRNILHNTNINTTIPAQKQEKFDYERLAKAIPKSSFSVNIDKDFIEESVSNGLSKTRHFNNRYAFK